MALATQVVGEGPSLTDGAESYELLDGAVLHRLAHGTG